MNQVQPPKPSCVPCVVTVAVGLLLLAIAYSWVSLIVQKVFDGAGLEHCCTIEGVRFNFIAVFVLLCGIAVAMMAAVIMQTRDWLTRRDFEKKYGVKVPASRERPTNYSESSSGSSFHGSEYGDGD